MISSGIHEAKTRRCTEVADIDGDGIQELIAAEDWNFISAFDVDLQVAKWTLPMNDPETIWVGNVDADADIEMLVGEG